EINHKPCGHPRGSTLHGPNPRVIREWLVVTSRLATIELSRTADLLEGIVLALVASGLVQADRARNAAAPPAAVHAMAPDACIPESVLVLVLVLVLDSY
ncbi:MAG: hypothetical protein UY97_C0014G0001, partial [Parcubacteria group bacterium GW2011_GWB1_57_6]